MARRMPEVRGGRTEGGRAAIVFVAVALLTACGGSDAPAVDGADPDLGPAEAAAATPAEPADFDADAWCALASPTVIAIRYDDPELLAGDIETLERMTELTSGQMREDHEAGLRIRREVLAVVEDLIEPGMDSQARRAAVDGHERVTAITQEPNALSSGSRLMGYHLEHCF